MASAKLWLEAARPKTLTAAAVPVAVGTALAAASYEAWSPLVAALALASATCIQVGTNLVNDSIDFERGADREGRLGPRRITQSGAATPRAVLRAGLLFFAAAAALAVPLVVRGGLPILAVGLLSIAFGYAYTGGPLPLAYVGLAEPFVLVFFGLVAVGGVHYLHTGRLGAAALLAGLQIGLLSCVLLAVNNLRDIEGDRSAGKRTLAARFGTTFGRLEIAALVSVPFALGALWPRGGFPAGAALLPLLASPLAVAVAIGTARNAPGPVYNRFLGLSALLHLAFGILLSIGFFVP